jgi:hypothetical protein
MLRDYVEITKEVTQAIVPIVCVILLVLLILPGISGRIILQFQ